MSKVSIVLSIAVGLWSATALGVGTAWLFSRTRPVQVVRLDNNCVTVQQGMFHRLECYNSNVPPHDPVEQIGYAE